MRWRAALLTLPLLLGVAACGDDDDTDDAAETTSGDAAACDAYLELTAAFNAEPDEAEVASLLDTLEAAKPDAIDAELQTMIDAVREAFDTGDFNFGENEEFMEATETVDTYVYDECAADVKIEANAVDYAFTGIPAEIDAGLTFLKITNATDSGEQHEIAVLQRNDGVTESWDELLALEEEAEGKVTFKGAAFVPSEGDVGVAYLDLEPGEYVAVCFVSVGGGEDGTPHHAEGMKHEFTVS